MPQTNSTGSWFFAWGGSAIESVDAEPNTEPQVSPPEEEFTQQVVAEEHNASIPANVVEPANAPEPADDRIELESAQPITKESHTSATVEVQTGGVQATSHQQQVLRHKTSSGSMKSLTASSWLTWTSKQAREASLQEKVDESEDNDDLPEDSVPRRNPSPDKIDEEDEPKGSGDDERESGSDDLKEGEEGSSSDKRKKSWSFWNGSDEANDRKAHVHTSHSNKILNSTPSIPSRDDLQNNVKKHRKTDSADSSNSQGNSEQSDAVLYKPHDSAKDFNKINTHKNQDFSENVLVPDWNTCLQLRSHAATASTSSDALSGGLSQAFDIKYWKNYLSHISTRLGFKSGPEYESDADADASTHDPHSDFPSEQELKFLQGKSYKLYGKSLSRLPPAKRACLPNFNKRFVAVSQEQDSKRQKTQLEEDSEDRNPVSITNDVAGNLLINFGNENQPKGHLHRSDVVSQKVGPLRKIKKILIIGVHGFFPTKMIRPIIGSPKGTSLKFANEAEKAVIRYLVENDMMNDHETHDLSIRKIALEKEGKIFDRVEFFTTILEKWKKELNEADFIFVAAHSQGCVASIILLARLIKSGILERAVEKRIGILGMAGVNNGPFYGIDKTFLVKAYSAIEHESLTELFELTKFDSPQSLAYKEAMHTIINANVKVCFVGSINDQLVPLYSALASHVFHPNIYRACYIDQSSRTPDFIKKLVSMCCQLQNLGYFDNNVIKELSPILAGSITGGGHSKIYNDGKVYDLGLKFVLDTDDMVIPSARSALSPESEIYSELPITNQVFMKEYNIGKIGTNPFILPWCLRGLIFNVEKNWREPPNQITSETGHEMKTGVEEINGLYESFDHWKPDTKALKELKFRLNGIRASKL